MTSGAGAPRTHRVLRAPATWQPWSRKVALRCALLLCAYLFWLGYLVFATHFHWALGGNTSDQSSSPNYPVPPRTMYQEDPGLTRGIFAVAAVALVIETASVLWRVARHSTRVGVTGLVAGGIGGVLALLGMLTIGPFIAPFAAICILLALPIGGRSTASSPPSSVPPGWYGDPTGRPQWRFWDGGAWTTHVATVDQGVPGPAA